MRVFIIPACMLVLLASCCRQIRSVAVPLPLQASLPVEGPTTRSAGIERRFAPDIQATFVASAASFRIHLAGGQQRNSDPYQWLVVCVSTPSPYRNLSLVLADPMAGVQPPELRSAVVSAAADPASEDVKARIGFSATRQVGQRSFPWTATIDIPWSLLFTTGDPDSEVQVAVYPLRVQQSGEILRLQPRMGSTRPVTSPSRELTPK